MLLMMLYAGVLGLSGPSLREILSPLTPMRFLARHWQQKPLLVRGGGARAGWQDKLFSWSQADAVVERSRSVADHSAQRMLNPRDFFLVKRVRGDDGEWWSAKHMAQQEASLAYVRSGFANGFTVVLNRV